jgi:hypothetical protein
MKRKKKKKEKRRKSKRKTRNSCSKIKNQVRPLGKITMVANPTSGKPLMETVLSKLRTSISLDPTTSSRIWKEDMSSSNLVISIPVCNSFNSETDKDFG